MAMTRRTILKAGASASALSILGRPALGATPGSASASGFHIPAEEGRHERTFMQWPVAKGVYGTQEDLEAVQETIARIANAISNFEPVAMLAAGDLHAGLRARLSQQVELWDIATDDLWCRDSGPCFVTNSEGALAMTAFNFNGWGGKQAHGNDGAIAGKIAERLGLHLFDNGLVGEHGGVETDGAGTAVAHESSWINTGRGKGSRDEIGQLILEATGARKLIWAPGIAGADITDYHIDSLARFVGPGTMVVQLPDEASPDDPWSMAAYETYAILERFTDANKKGISLTIVPEPYEPRIKEADFVASYVNFYVCNGAVIMPQFGDKATDAEAQASIGALYPGREVVTLEIDALGQSGGGIHCATHQQPASTGNYKP
jgi:agmatine deiminase